MKILTAHIFLYRSVKSAFGNASHYSGYVHIFFLIGISVWLYLFVGKNFIAPRDDFKFIKENIPNVSYIQLNEAVFKGVYQKYEEKLDGKQEIEQGIKSPF